MITRFNIACETCGHKHTVRIGLGREEVQKHLFPCAGCKENIGIILKIPNPPNIEFIFDNAIDSDKDGTIINLDANFLVDPCNHGDDHVANRVQQMHDIFMAQRQHIDAQHGAGSFVAGLLNNDLDKYVVPFDSEWPLLKKAWSLSRNSEEKLVKIKIRDANKTLYGYESLDDIEDWLWRFSSKLCMGNYETLFQEAMESIAKPPENKKEFK